MAAPGGLMNESERRDILKTIEQRKNELMEKRKLLEALTARGESRKLPETGDVTAATLGARQPISSSALLEQVMTEVANAAAKPKAPPLSVAQSSAETELTKPAKQPTTPECIAAGGTPAGPTGMRYSKALKKVIGAMAMQAGSVDIQITPRVMDRFEKSCQCELTSEPTPSAKSPKAAHKPEKPSGGVKVTAQEVSKATTAQPTRMAPAKVPDQPALTLKPTQVEELSETERKKVMYGPQFESFFAKASRVVEKALNESELFDVFVDYSDVFTSEERHRGAGEQLRDLGSYSDMRWSQNRSVLGLKTHPKFNELFLACYGQKRDAGVNDPDGCALVWNISMTQRPEFVFFCQSQVCSAMFDTYRPNCILGGTFSGSIVIWDTRAKTRPVQRTPLSQKGHRHPVYSMDLVGTENAHSLVTIDTDGHLCLWSRAMMVQPTECIELKHGGRESSVLCMAFAEGESNFFMAGSDDGSLLHAQLHGTKVGVTDAYAAHLAPVTSLHWHPSTDAGDDAVYSDLLLSSSFDWTVKLWSPKTRATPLQTFGASSDYCLDVEWHPRHPAVFGSCQTNGNINVWDLSKDIELSSVMQSTGDAAAVKLKWANDGSRLMTGNSEGVISMWGVSNNISQPRSEACDRFAEKIEELKTMEHTTRNSGVV